MITINTTEFVKRTQREPKPEEVRMWKFVNGNWKTIFTGRFRIASQTAIRAFQRERQTSAGELFLEV